MVLDPARKVRLFRDPETLGWTRAFERQSSVRGGTGGWRLADGGKSIALPGGRSLWIWGDSFATFNNGIPNESLAPEPTWGIKGSTIALSGREPPPAAPIKFWGREP